MVVSLRDTTSYGPSRRSPCDRDSVRHDKMRTPLRRRNKSVRSTNADRRISHFRYPLQAKLGGDVLTAGFWDFGLVEEPLGFYVS